LYMTINPTYRALFESFRGRVVAITFTDDIFASPKYASRFVELFGEGAWVESRVIDPKIAGWGNIGHAGAFKESQKRTLWEFIWPWVGEGKELVEGVGEKKVIVKGRL